MHKLFFYILNCVVNGAPVEDVRLQGLSPNDWQELYRLAKQQGVTAVLFEKIKPLPREVAPPRELALRWMSHAMAIEKQTKSIAQRCADFAQLMHTHGLKTLVLKGVAVSMYYPNPWHREYGDLHTLPSQLYGYPLRNNLAKRAYPLPLYRGSNPGHHTHGATDWGNTYSLPPLSILTS